MAKPAPDETVALLRELVELQRSSVRLQKLAISLQAEALAYASFATQKDPARPAIEKHVMTAVEQIRKTAERVEAGRKLPK